MRMFSAIRRSGGRHEVCLSEKAQSINSFLPEDGSEIIDNVLEKLGVTMRAGAIKDAVSNACGALIVKQLHPELAEKLGVKEVIEGTKRDLGFMAEGIKHCEGKPLDVAEYVIGQIQGIIDPSSAQQEQVTADLSQKPNHQSEDSIAA